MRGVQLTIGAHVHYRSWGSAPGPDGVQVHAPQCRPAVVVEVMADSELCTLFVINPAGVFFDECRHNETRWVGAPPGEGGTWHWPCDQVGAGD